MWVQGSDGKATCCPRLSRQPLVSFASQPQKTGHIGSARLSAIIIFPLLHISASKWFALLSRFYHPPVKCYTLITVSCYLAEANWLSLINQRSWGLDDCEGHKRSYDFLHRATPGGYGVRCAGGWEKQSVEPLPLSFPLVNLY